MPSIALAGVAFAVQYLLVVGSLAFWIARDADARGSGHVLLWGLGSVLTNGLVGVVYFLTRSDIGERTRPPTRGERLARTVVLAALPAWVLAATFAPPDPVTHAFYGLGLLAVALPLAYVLDYRNGYARLRRRVG